MSIRPVARYSILVLVLVACIAVLGLSVVPFNRIALGTRPGPGFPAALIERAAYIHVAVHIVGYGILACLAWFVAGVAAAGAINKMIALTVVTLLGCTTEYLQHRLYHHPIELDDVFTNIVSTAVVFGLLALRTPLSSITCGTQTRR